MKGGIAMKIGDKIELPQTFVPHCYGRITKINDVINVKYCDDGDEQWFEAVDPAKSDLVMLKCSDNVGEEVVVIFSKEANFDMLIYLL